MMHKNRKQRRATKANNQLQPLGSKKLDAEFRKKLDELAVLGGFANHVSMAFTGLPTTQLGALSSAVFAKCCAHGRSILAVALQSSMFDHHAIIAIARMVMEASTMVAYLRQAVSENERDFRHTLLMLHDTVSRIKLLRAYGAPTDDLKAGRDALKGDLVRHPFFEDVPEARKTRLLSGEEMFVPGMRSVATKIVGWNEDQFTGIYAYFSAHTHSAPMSFTRMERHEIDYFFPSKAQTDLLGLALEVTIACLRRSMLLMLDEYPDRQNEFHPNLLDEAREADRGSPSFDQTPS